MPRWSWSFDWVSPPSRFMKKRVLSFASYVRPVKTFMRFTSAPYGPPLKARFARSASVKLNESSFGAVSPPAWLFVAAPMIAPVASNGLTPVPRSVKVWPTSENARTGRRAGHELGRADLAGRRVLARGYVRQHEPRRHAGIAGRPGRIRDDAEALEPTVELERVVLDRVDALTLDRADEVPLLADLSAVRDG